MHTEHGTTPLSRAKAEVEKILRSLRSGDRAALLFVAAAPRAALPQPTPDLGILRDELDLAQVTQEQADLSGALEQAVALQEAGAGTGGQWELYLVSDFQRTNWAAVELASVPPEMHLYLVDVDDEIKHNTAVTQLPCDQGWPSSTQTRTVPARSAPKIAASTRLPPSAAKVSG